MNRLLIGLVSTVLVMAGVADAAAQEKRRGSSTEQRRGSVQPVRRGSTGHRASGGSVRFDRPSRATPTRSDSGTLSRRPGVRTGTEVRRSTSGGTIVTRGSTAPRIATPPIRGYHPAQTRHHASTGSLRHHRPPIVRPTPLPGRFPVRDVRVYSYPRYGTRITHLPSTRRVIVHRGHNYYVSGGIYYRAYRGGYTVCRPPIGVRLPYLPQGFVVVSIGGRPYYRYHDTYYVQEIVNDVPSYVVVQPPEDAIIDFLPPDAQEVYFRGRPYYVDIYEEIAYEPVLINGQTYYRPTDLDVDVDFEDDGIEIEIEED